MKSSKKKSWKLPKKKSAQPPPRPHDDDFKDLSDVKVCVCNNFLFVNKHSGISVLEHQGILTAIRTSHLSGI